MLKQQWWIVSAVVAVLVACGGSKKPAACVTGTAGAKACSAADGGTAGMSSSGGTGGSSTSSGSSGSGSGSGGKGGSGGTGGSGSGGSASTSDAGGSGSGGSSSTFPMDGNQLSVCTHLQGDCNKGFGCTGYVPPGQGFCTKTCTMDADCMSLSGAKYTCPGGGGLCVISCMDAMDTTSCPSGMTCQAVPTFGGMGMGTPMFRCKYPSPPDAGMMMTAGTTPEWAKCTAMSTGMSACAMGLTCVGTGSSMSRTGFCSKTCTMDTECSTKPSSGSIAPSCVPNGTRGAQTCALPCMPMGTGCPDMMTCVAGTMGAPSYCQFM